MVLSIIFALPVFLFALYYNFVTKELQAWLPSMVVCFAMLSVCFGILGICEFEKKINTEEE